MTAADSLFSTTDPALGLPQPGVTRATLPLTMATVGAPMRLVAVRTGHQLTHRLAELGLTVGVSVTIVQDAGGPLLVAVRGSRVAIGRGIAHQLQVVPEQDHA